MFFYVWTGRSKFRTKEYIDLHILNESLFAECVLQALPQILLQLWNNWSLGEWPLLALISLGTSGAVFILGVIRYGSNALSASPYLIKNVPIYLWTGLEIVANDEEEEELSISDAETVHVAADSQPDLFRAGRVQKISWFVLFSLHCPYINSYFINYPRLYFYDFFDL